MQTLDNFWPVKLCLKDCCHSSVILQPSPEEDTPSVEMPGETPDDEDDDDQLIQGTYDLDESLSSGGGSTVVSPSEITLEDYSNLRLQLKESQYKLAIAEAEIPNLKIQVSFLQHTLLKETKTFKASPFS